MEHNFNIEVGNRIRSARKKMNYSMKKLGELVDLHESTVSRYEKGDIKQLDIEKLKEFATVLNVTPQYLFGLDSSFSSMDNMFIRLKSLWLEKIGNVHLNENELTELVNYAMFIISKRGAK